MALSESTKKIKENVRRQYATPIIPDVKQALLDEVAGYPKGNVAVLLSGGIDSIAVLHACIAADLKPVAYSFHVDGIESTDHRLAQQNARSLGVPFRSIVLPNTVDEIRRYVKAAVNKYGLRGKSDIEVCWPMLTAMRQIEEMVILSGIGSDTYFVTSKKGQMHLRDMVDRYRAHNWRKPNAQRALFKRFCAERGKIYHSPYESPRFWAEVHDATDYDALHGPEKRLLREAFPELMRRCKVKNHTNLQLGDSGIAKQFELLLDDPQMNPNGGKSVVSVYNHLAKNVNTNNKKTSKKTKRSRKKR
jgi:asparagine synthetase B (glutamine-hydrolysing)